MQNIIFFKNLVVNILLQKNLMFLQINKGVSKINADYLSSFRPSLP